ncbi:hypothetical protein Patl1_24508 [Pistacia atlantica]|uniref:Uncharacterized protein n=1 Tax=Pistacia atlantica TaxID=434234 RepID=A0ACC0ZY92_9ROSI|nr:hypothetical protein Patl1_24508 [Pistacia atlantica]
MVELGVGPCFSEANRGNGCHEGFMQFILILQCYRYISAFAVEQIWFASSYQSNPDGLKGKKHVPATLEWGEAKGTCVEPYNSGTIFCNEDNYCLIQLTSGHVCLCEDRRSETSLGCRGTLYCNMTSGQDCSKCPPDYEYDHQLQCWARNVVTTHGNMVVVQVHQKKKRNEAEAEIL